jgi:hypothetical protein
MKTLLQEMQEQENCKKYTAWNGKTCYRMYGDLDYYFLKCVQYGLKPKMQGDFSYTAKGDGFEFEYCEHDIIYAEDFAL